jgi:hypothetical protein
MLIYINRIVSQNLQNASVLYVACQHSLCSLPKSNVMWPVNKCPQMHISSVAQFRWWHCIKIYTFSVHADVKSITDCFSLKTFSSYNSNVAAPCYVLHTQNLLLQGQSKQKLNSFIELFPTWEMMVFVFVRFLAFSVSNQVNHCSILQWSITVFVASQWNISIVAAGSQFCNFEYCCYFTQYVVSSCCDFVNIYIFFFFSFVIKNVQGKAFVTD